ncbi:cadherin domain-containing protein [Sphingosinicella sp. LHD-64]|uniref:cadherin domain-containing protein n=1 Tax=Sphingosinicella sp. LHD-64 TaxID=3072139 RepID=UPI00280EBAA8|nr:cadherin domain-containing protein [Sphingosinicella sp. LHD-64]MDQ8757648.1 cadherin domain-containing protein [Sphingosinicella sp. LHD-64]
MELTVVDGQVVKSEAWDGLRNGQGFGVTVETLYASGQPVSTSIKLNNNPIGIEFSQAGGIIGQQLGFLLADGNRLVGAVASATLQTVGDNLGDMLDGVVGNMSIDKASKDAFRTFDTEFLANLKSAGIGAVSSFLTAELVDALGVGGFAGELINTTAGTVINTILSNLAGIGPGSPVNPFEGLNAASIGTAIGSFLGNRLANEIVSFDTVGGQLGAAIGSSLGVIGVTAAIGANGTLLGVQLGAFAGPIGALVGAFLGTLLGGLIGSIFGGTPRSGADVVWDEAKQGFVVANVYSKKGGSKDAARSMATAAADTFNSILAATGGVLENPSAVQAGNYGMRKKDYVYRPYSTRDTDAIQARFSGKDGAARLIGYGVLQGLTDPDFRIMGGDIYVKRALYNGLAGANAQNFDPATVLGNIATAQRYETYLANSTSINALIAAEPDSVFTAEWAITFARAVELGLTRRHESDWYGGFNLLLDEAQTNAANMAFGFDYDPFADRVSRTIGIGEFVLGDSIDIAGQTVIEGTANADTIKLSATQLLVSSGTTNAGLTVDGAAHNGAARDIDVAATIDAGDGDDTVHASDRGDNVFGGTGNDTLYGGRLDDWLLGGDGNDVIHAGTQAGGLGGDGNYLDGGAGDDALYGREGSDWLEGGEGTDVLIGGAGGDILAGGAGDGDVLKGGAGDDHYLYRKGDGADTAEDEAGAPPAAPGSDPLRVRLAGLAAGTIARDWIGEGDWMPRQSTPPSGSTPINAGEDRLVLGAGIGLENVRLSRGGTLAGTTADDLVLELTDAAGVPTGDRLLMKGWYDSYKRIEWLQFADGQAIRIGDFQTFIAGSAGNDTIIGTNGRDFAVGGPGNDWMSLLGGDDVGVGGSGKDWVSGDGDNDLLVGGDDDDRVLGGSGDDTLSGDGGADELDGGTGRDVIAGGRGNDTLTGGTGDDIFRFARGDGRDTIIDALAGTLEVIMARNPTTGWIDYVNGFTRDANNRVVRGSEVVFDGTNWVEGVQFDVQLQQLTRSVADPTGRTGQDATQSWETGDALEFGLGINIQDVMLAGAGWDLYVGISNENANVDSVWSLSDHIRLADWYRDGDRPIEKFVFAATGVLNVEATSLLGGTNEADTLEGANGDDWITGNGGDDTLRGHAGKDILNGNAGSDTIEGGGDDDVLYGGAGNDVLDGGAGADILVGGDGGDVASYASASASVAAYLGASFANSGDARGDTFHGIEDLTGSANNDFALGGDDGDNVIVGGAGNDALFGGKGDDTYVWNAWDYGDTIDDRSYVIEEIVNAAGELAAGYTASWTRGMVYPTPSDQPQRYQWRLKITAADGEIVYDNATYLLPADSPQPVPSAYIQAGWKNGFSRVLNGASNDQQVVRQKFDDGADGGEDTLELGIGISLKDLTFEHSGADLIVRYQNNEFNFVRIKGQASANSAIEWLQLADGLAVSLASLQIIGPSSELQGTAGNDLLIGSDLGDPYEMIAGGDGNDVIVGLGGMNALDGGAGDDTFETGAGMDFIDGGTHTEIGASDTAGDTVRYVGSGAAVTVDLRLGMAGTQSGGDAQGDYLTNIENVVGSQANGDNITGDDGGNRLIGLGGNDTLTGLGGKDVLLGDEGDDLLYGGVGDDNLSGGEGADQLWGDDDNDTIDGGAGNDILKGGGGNDVLVGGHGNDNLDGDSGEDELIGDVGNDVLNGGDGNDKLTGGLGNDQLDGSIGDDVYVFSAASGEDIIVDWAGLNDIAFDQSVDHTRIWLSRITNSNDLRITVIGGTSVITVKDFFSGSGLVHRLRTTSHTLYLSAPDALQLIADMAQVSATTPSSMPQAISAKLATYWHAGGKAPPRAAPLAVATDEDVELSLTDLGVVDHDHNIVSYAISAPPSLGYISGFDPGTGALTYTPNWNVHGTDRLTITVRDADGHSTEIPIEIIIAPVNDAPEDLSVDGSGTLSVLEAAPESSTGAGTIVGQFTAVDPEGDLIFWTLIDSAGGRFGLTNEGLLVVVSPELLDYSQATSHDIVVRATDAQGAYFDATFTVSVENVNEAPNAPIVGDLRGTVDESFSGSGPALANTWVARFTLSDPDGTVPTLRLVSNPSSRFKIVGNEVRFADGYEPDFETLYAAWQAGDTGITMTDYDGDGRLEAILAGSVEAFDGTLASPAVTSFTARIQDINEAPISLDWTPAATSVPERDRVSAGTPLPAITLGTLSVTDPDISGFAHGSYVFSVSDSRFEIAGNELRLKLGAVLDYEAQTSVLVAVTATDQSGVPFTITGTISIPLENRDDVLEGDANANPLVGQQNRDLIYGYGGNDTLDGGDGNDLLDGGSGNDRLLGGNGNDELLGGDGNDVLVGDAGADSLNGGANDVGAQDMLYGGDGDDSLNGGDGDDDLIGGAGADQLTGGNGVDRANYAWLTEGVAATAGVTVDLATPSANTGAAAGDTYSGVENILGTGYADILRGDAASNRIDGGGGNDEIHGRDGDDALYGNDGADLIHGGNGADLLEGGAGHDIIYGGAGDDDLFGGDGDDELYAESGDDYLDGGAGNDILNGGIDNDTYIVNRQSGADTIFNYDPSGDDIDVLGLQDTYGTINDEDLWFERPVGSDDLLISVIETSSSVLIKNWYVLADAQARSNYKIDFIIAGESYTNTINAEGLVNLMAGRTKPSTATERDTLMSDPTFRSQWENFWGVNAPPSLAVIADQPMNEGGTLGVTVSAADDLTPDAGLQVVAEVTWGKSLFSTDPNQIVLLPVGQPDGNGDRTLTITPLSNVSGSATIRVTVTDAGGISTPREFTVTINPVATKPDITRFVGGSGTSGQAGIALTVDVDFPDDDGSEAHEIWIAGVPAGVSLSAGSYDSTNSVWKLTRAQLIDLKVNAPVGWSQDLSLTVTARATEGGSTAISDAKTTTVVINAPPTGATLSGSVNENAANTSHVGYVSGIDPDAGDTLTYTLINNAGGRFALNATSGQLTVANGSLLNFETATSHGITVRITDAFGQYTDKALSVTVNNVNEANSLPTAYSFSIDENVAAGTPVGTVTATDLDNSSTTFGQQTYAFRINPTTLNTTSADGRYVIDATTGIIRTNAVLDREAPDPSKTYTVVALDNPSGSIRNEVSTEVTIGINDVNETNSLPGTYSFNVNEKVAIGTTVGTVAATDLDNSGTSFGQQRYAFRINPTTLSATSADGRYVIDPISGAIRTNAALDREAPDPSKAYTVVALDNPSGSIRNEASTEVTIGINDVNEVNSLPSSHSFSVHENMASGTPVGTVVASDLDSPSTTFGQQNYAFRINLITLSTTSADGRYVIDAVTGVIRTNVVFNYETDPHTSYTVVARDNPEGSSQHEASTTVYLNLADVNESPTIGNQTFAIAERPSDTLNPILTLAWGDQDIMPANRRHVFRIDPLTDPGGFFLIDNAGRITARRHLNYEDVNYRNFTLRVTVTDQDGTGLSAAADITVNLTNVNESPYATSQDSTFWNLAPANSLVSIITHNDPDIGDVISYQVTSVFNMDVGGGSPSDYRVQANGSTAYVYTNHTMGRIQYQTREQVTVRVSDAAGASSYTTFLVSYNVSKPLPPVVLDLDGDGVELVSKSVSNVHVDMDGDGVLDRTGWVAADDGFLALDRNGDGIVTDMSETSFISDVPGSVSDMEGLRAFDTNENGLLDADDEAFASFMVWQDLNQDGISQTSEIRSLSQASIAFINLTLNLTGENPENTADNIIYATGEYGRTDGSLGLVGDVMLAYEPSNPQVAPPIVFDLDGDGVTTTELVANPALFDMDGDGVLDRTGWVGAADGLLALDRNGDGVIRGISEISFVGDLEGARTDLEGLAAFDSNRDGQLSAADTKFADFRVWVDANQDGVSDAGELKRLAEVGIVSIALKGEATGAPTVPGRNVIYNETTFLRGDGTSGLVGDVGLAFIGSKTGVSTTGENQATPASYSFERKSSRYRIETSGGGIYVRDRKARGVVDAAAGGISNASMLDFDNGAYGLAAAVVIDFDLDGLELEKRKNSDATFDMNADGTRDDTGWINHNEALLVLDRNGNGIVDGTGEISFVGDREGAKTGLEGLLAFDSNRDGVLSDKDARFAEFRIWRDRNGDGRSDAGELYSLTDIGIASIELDRRAIDGRWKHGRNVIASTSTFTRTDGRTGTVGDVALAYRPSAVPSVATTSSDALAALRRGLANPFNRDTDSDAGTWESDSGELSLPQDVYQRRLAFAVQEMASFGGSAGEGEYGDRLHDRTARFDYFAA